MRTSQDPNAPAWFTRIGAVLLSRRTLLALLWTMWALEALVLFDAGGSGKQLALVTNTPAVIVASYARTRPVHCALGLIGILMLSVVLPGADLATIGLLTPTEITTVLLVVLHLVRSRPIRLAAPIVSGLTITILGIGIVRENGLEPREVAFAALALMLTAGTALYLRHERSPEINTPLRQLLSRQWPVMAALSIVLFFEMLDGHLDFASSVLFLCSTVMAGLAVLGPMRPTETTLLGALTLLLTTVFLQIINRTSDGTMLPGIPLGAHAASMLLLAFAVRWAPRRQAMYAVGGLLAACLYAALASSDSVSADLRGVLVETATVGGLFATLSVGTGLYFRARDSDRAKTVQSAVSQAKQAERMALARELHDVVAHHVTGIVVQAQAAQMVAGKKPEAAGEALDRIAHSGTEALAAMRRLVSSMRGAEPVGASGAVEQATTDLKADLEALLVRANRLAAENPEAARLELDVDIGHEVPQDVARSALRLTQESITNAEKHALDASVVRVAITTSERHMHMLITDDGEGRRAQPVGGSGGYGLVGMRERVELLGGQFRAGPGSSGWMVEAWLPLESADDESDEE